MEEYQAFLSFSVSLEKGATNSNANIEGERG